MKPSAVRGLIRFRTRFVIIERKLKIPASCAVPFCGCDVMLINSIDQSTLRFQEGGLTYAVLKRRDQTGCNVLPNSARALFRRGGRGGERFFAGSDCLNVVGDSGQLAAHV